MQRINIGKDFSDHPIGRYREDGPESGQVFRDDYLIPKLESLGSNEKLEIILDDGVDGYGSSFLVEAFAGVVKVGYMHSDELLKKLVFKYTDEDFSFFEEKIKEYIQEARYGSIAGGRQ
ncbi:STAS-like domain-containing protein [Halomonas alkalicola]|uniref:STAS-like domain-containing protein n=1 Tax=Halomonas alkalicola TaxID=1930622 RepID=UPI00265DD4A6|nr:DUF4325 domain-containing protein [Halomonas alkalicola]